MAFRFFPLLAVLAVVHSLGGFPAAQAQAPQIVSVTPTNGATGVGATTPIVFKFDQDMDMSVAVFMSPPPAVGSLLIDPANVGSQMFGAWTDNRTLTVSPLLTVPLNITITWTLNPAGVLSFFQIKSAAGVVLATATGSYTTGVGAPALGSTAPADGTENVPTNTVVAFRFTQPMKKIAVPAGVPSAVLWSGTGIDPSNFVYTWSVDGRVLNAEYRGGFPRNTEVGWVLNPSSAPEKFESQAGQAVPVDTYQGTFITAVYTPCNINPLPPTWGNYGLVKRSGYEQTSSADPVDHAENTMPHIFSVAVNSPAFGPNVTAGSVEFPDGTRTNLTSNFVFQYFETFATAAELDAKYPPGTYTIRFTQTGQPERVVPISMSAADSPPVPKITNFDALQSINPAQAFTLQWNAFANADADDFISMYISDDFGRIYFQAPDLCIPLPLPPTSTSIVVPANTLRQDRTYTGEILFGKSFYFSTNAIPDMWGYGNTIRSTSFTLKTGTGTNPGQPPVLSAPRVLPDGSAAFDLTGTAGQTYGIQRADSVDATTWPEVSTVVANGSGMATYQEPLGTGPRYYRAMAK